MWCFLLNCLSTRAVHIDVVFSRHKLVKGVERYIARRGTPTTIMSDNGTNFVGTQKDPLACVEIRNKFSPAVFFRSGIKWELNPPSAPHHVGSWEPLFRSIKRVVYDILGNRRVTEDVLRTRLCLVEQSLKARPKTSVSSNPRDLEALTPNHFTLGQHVASFPSLIFEENFNHKKRFARAQANAKAIWTRWMREYVPYLNMRAEWQNQSELKLKGGDCFGSKSLTLHVNIIRSHVSLDYTTTRTDVRYPPT